MGTEFVDQIGPDGELIQAVDTELHDARKNELLLGALPGARVETYAGERVVRFGDQLLLKKQVTHLGRPWPGFKKRIQIPRKWIDVERQASADGLRVRFIGIYHFGAVTIFVDFDPSTYITRKANNSAAHVSTNDLFQAQTLGQFTRVDARANRRTSVRDDLFARYLVGDEAPRHPRIEVFREFNKRFIGGSRLESLMAVQAMHDATWPDRFQGEWPGFYLEFRLHEFLNERRMTNLVTYQKAKSRGGFDFDLVFPRGADVDFYGDLKASNALKRESPGNDAADLIRCVEQYGRFWYVVYEHETWHARDNEDRATIAWNEWRRSVGHVGRGHYDPLSYRTRFKEAVRFVRMSILEVNQSNFHLVLSSFNQGKQPDGAARAVKVMIKKSNVDNFLIYSEPPGATPEP